MNVSASVKKISHKSKENHHKDNDRVICTDPRHKQRQG